MSWLPSSDGLWIVDRTLAGPDPRRFVPTSTNVLALPLDNRNATAAIPLIWGLYTGRWGPGLPPSEGITITCLAANRAHLSLQTLPARAFLRVEPV